eukprot:gene27688-36443_t
MVKEISSLSEFEKEISSPGLVVVDFFTTWCGPCKQIAPLIEQLALKYPDVKFIKVDIEKNRDISEPRQISSIPTFHFIVGGKLKDEMKGANPTQLESKINQWKNAREARLRAFDSKAGSGSVKPPSDSSSSTSSSAPAPPSSAPISDEFDEDEALAKALQLSLAEAATAAAASAPSATPTNTAVNLTESTKATNQEERDYLEAEAEQDAIDNKKRDDDWGDEMVPVPVDETLLSQLLDMGFSDIRGRKSIVHGKNLEGALAWLSEHQDDPDIDQPYMVKKSDTIPKTPLTEEEKAQRILAIRDRVKQRRTDREKQEKAEELRREKERRERGQKIDETVEERQRMQRKRDAEKLKKEKA